MPELRMAKENICDFCSAPNPTCTFECPDFPVADDGGTTLLNSRGAWMACAVCGSFITQGNWDRLLLRAVDALYPKYQGMMPRRILTDTIKRSHDLFREHYKKA
jgi:hypothetical protein